MGTGRQHPMSGEACLPGHWVNIILLEIQGWPVCNWSVRQLVYDLLRNRQLSLPVSTISQWRVSRSGKVANGLNLVFALVETAVAEHLPDLRVRVRQILKMIVVAAKTLLQHAHHHDRPERSIPGRPVPRHRSGRTCASRSENSSVRVASSL